LSVASHTTLHELFRSVARDIQDPRTGRSLFEVWRDLQNQFRQVPGVDGWGEFFDSSQELTAPWIFETPYDDAAPFFYYLAMPASDMYYGADYGMYHSIYENFHWMKTVVDPTFEYHILMSQVQGLVALRLANADLLPLDYANEASYWQMAYRDLEKVANERGQVVPELADGLGLVGQWKEEAEALLHSVELLLGNESRMRAAKPQLAQVNRRIYQVARDFLRTQGRPGMPTDRNLFAGSSYEFAGVSGSTLPGVRFALDQDDLETARTESALYIDALRRRVKNLQSIRREIQQIQ
jgi:N-acetylated-alpha-linked acidic dipeptidase